MHVHGSGRDKRVKPYARQTAWMRGPREGWNPAPAGSFSTMWFTLPGMKPIKVGG